MPINQHNIVRFIAQLYQEKKGKEAPSELLNSWANLSDEDINRNLSGLFESWGMSPTEKDIIVNKFLEKEHLQSRPAFNPNNFQQIPQQTDVSSHSTSTVSSSKIRKKRSVLTLLLILPFAVLAGYVAYKYVAYNALNRVYAITQNIAIRDAEGKMVGRMDLYPDSLLQSVSSLRALDNSIYYIQPEGSTKEYPSRKLISDTLSFRDYLFNRTVELFVNVNYLVDDKKEYNLYANAFQDIQNVDKDNNQLNASIRKVIVGSMVITQNMEDKYIPTYSEGLNKNIISITSNLVIQSFNNDQEYVIIAPLSDGFYYKFEGNLKTNSFKPLTQISLIDENKNQIPLTGSYRFIQSEGVWKLYDVQSKSSTYFELKKDAQSRFTHFEYTPTYEISTEPTLINKLTDAINEIFN